jgi:hypothetical protein
MLQRLNKHKTGYTLYDLGHRYELHSRHGIYSGTLDQVKTYATRRLSFNPWEFDLAVEEMSNAFHECCEFGSLGLFMYTFDRLDTKYIQ